MNTNFLRLCSIAFVVFVLSAYGGGGGGGSSSNADGTPTAKTKPTTITVIDGYIQGAIVCVDKSKSGTCDTGETQAKTGDDGKVTLDIPVDDVGKYPIVAYIPADAIDLDNPEVPVGKTYTMSAPADQSAIVSPLSTLVKRLMDKGGKTTAEATAQIKLTVGDATINYMESEDAKAIRMAAKMLAKLMQDPSKLVMPSNINDAQKQAAMMDALIAKLADIQSKARALVAPGTACAIDMTAQSCQSAIEPAIATLLLNSNPGTPQAVVSQTASITMASAGDLSLNSGDRTDSLRPTWSGTYSAALGSDHTVHVLDSTSDQGAATVYESTKTWTFTPTADLSPGPHSFTAVVVRNRDSVKGTASSAYTVNVGNSVNAGTGSNVLDTITLTLSNLWGNVKSVVLSIPNTPSNNNIQGDLVDGQTSKTLTAPNSGLWSTVTTAFKTTGNKVINLVFKDQADQEVDRSSINVNITSGTVSQKASLISIKDHATPIANEIVAGQITKDSTPVISGTVDVSLSQYYDLAVFDNGTKLTGSLSYTNNRKDWSFTPASALSQGEHTITAGVVRIDGVEGPKDSERKFVLLLSNIAFSPATPQLGLPVSFSASNIWSNITTVLWNFGDGVTLRDFTYEGRSNVQHTFAESSDVGNKTVTVSYVDTTGKTVVTEQLILNLGAPPLVTQLATITTIKDGNTILQNGDTAMVK